MRKSIKDWELMSPKAFREMKRMKSIKISKASKPDPIFEYKDLKEGFLKDKEEDAIEEIKAREEELKNFKNESKYFEIKVILIFFIQEKSKIFLNKGEGFEVRENL
jgi:hypothetical protein